MYARAEEFATLGKIVAVSELGQTKIHHPHPARLVEHDVGRLDVSMEDPLPGRIIQSLGHLLPNPRDIPVISPVRAARNRRCSERADNSPDASAIGSATGGAWWWSSVVTATFAEGSRS